MRTLVALAVRDRAPLVEACLESLVAALRGAAGEWLVAAWLDPLDVETGAEWLVRRGAGLVATVGVDSTAKGSARAHALRKAAAEFARANSHGRVLFLDSDVVVSFDFALEFERLWAHLGPLDCGALAMGNYEGYERYVVERLPELGATVRKYGLGACLAFPTDRLASAFDAAPAAWDTKCSRVAARHRVLTSDVSYVRHDGRDSGLSAQRGRASIDFSNLAFDLRQ